MLDIKIGVVGTGHFGKAIAQAFIRRAFCKAENIFLVDRSKTILELTADIDLLILSVRPQDFEALQKENNFSSKCFIVSVMAGVRQETIEQEFSLLVVRAMPNIAAPIGSGITVYKTNPNLSEQQSQILAELFAHWGKSLAVEDESLLDVATAISGSGPGILYWLLREIIFSAKAQGFSESQAEILVKEMLSGALAHWKNSEQSLEKLIEAVASKGGTTQAALEYLTEKKAGTELKEALVRAANRCKELGK